MSAANPVTLVFLYGALRPGSPHPHATFLSFRCRRLGNARFPGRLFRFGLQFAAIYELGAAARVTGDILELPVHHTDQILESLDRYEGIGCGMPDPPAFRREKVIASLNSGEQVECWAWLFGLPVHGLVEVRSGDALA